MKATAKSQRDSIIIFDDFPFALAATHFANRAAESYGACARVLRPSKRYGLRRHAVLVIVADRKAAKSLKLTVKTHNGCWRRDLPRGAV